MNSLRAYIALQCSSTKSIFAHQGFCVYKALANCDMIMCILTALRPVYNESFHCCNESPR